MAFNLKRIASGMLGNMSTVSNEELIRKYGAFLMEGEQIVSGFTLVRDSVLFTDKRIVTIDHQGATGKKTRYYSIYLPSIILVTCETAGFGMDDSEIEITYITTPNLKSLQPVTDTVKFEFPKKYQIQELYKMLQEIAYDNWRTLNGIQV